MTSKSSETVSVGRRTRMENHTLYMKSFTFTLTALFAIRRAQVPPVCFGIDSLA